KSTSLALLRSSLCITLLSLTSTLFPYTTLFRSDRPAFRAAFARRRCLLPADAYYEWQLLHTSGEAQPGTSPVTDPEHRSRKAKTRKRPFAVRYADDRPLALAGIFERWRDPAVPEE